MQDIELKLFIGLSRARKKLSLEAKKLFASYNLTEPQFGVLEALYSKGSLSIGEVQDKILTTSGTIAVVVKNLEKEGLIKRCADTNDQRKFILSLSQTGEKLIKEVFPKNKELIEKMMSKWTQEEKEVLLKLLKKF